MITFLEGSPHVKEIDSSVPTRWNQLGFWKWLLVVCAFLLIVLLLFRELDIQNQKASETCRRYWHSNDLIEKEELSNQLFRRGVFACRQPAQPG